MCMCLQGGTLSANEGPFILDICFAEGMGILDWSREEYFCRPFVNISFREHGERYSMCLCVPLCQEQFSDSLPSLI